MNREKSVCCLFRTESMASGASWPKLLMHTACLVLTVCAISGVCSGAGQEATGNAQIITGKVTATKIRPPKGGGYDVLMDEKGKDLCRTMKGVSVTIRANVLGQGRQRKVRVLGYVHGKDTAAHELWRRMRCNACVVQSAQVNVFPPPQLLGAVPVSGRYYSFKDRILAWDEDGKDLWIAMDNRIERIDMAARRDKATYDRRNGLPDHWIYQLLSDGRTVWIVHRAGVAALDIESGVVQDVAEAGASFAKVCTAEKGVWILADQGTWRLEAPGRIVERAPPLPMAKRIQKRVRNGMWIPHWHRDTKHFVANPVAIGGNVYAESYGSIYGVERGEWRQIAGDGWELREANGKLWFLGVREVAEYDPETGDMEKHPIPPQISGGRPVHLLVTDHAAWVAVTPSTSGARGARSGGLGRLDVRSGSWKTWTELDGKKLNHISCLTSRGSALWLVALAGHYRTSKAHPGMAYVTRNRFGTDAFSLHGFEEKKGKWSSLPLRLVEVEKRMICGQDGRSDTDVILPQSVESISVNDARIFAVHHLFPKRFFSGYWPCVSRMVSRSEPGAAWRTDFTHRPEQLNLQGEQPLVLNISNKGEMILKAVGHNDILALFLNGTTEWVVTEGGVAFFDEGGARWRRVFDGSYRWYWRATAAWDDGEALYIGSDRGLLSRLDDRSGLFEIMAGFRDQAVDCIARDASGRLVAIARQSPLGQFPDDMPTDIPMLDCGAAVLEDGAWRVLAKTPPLRQQRKKWFIKLTEARKGKNIKGGRDRSNGNFLFGPSVSGDGAAVPRFYLRDIFWPKFLCEGKDRESLWVSTFTGLIRVDMPSRGDR